MRKIALFLILSSCFAFGQKPFQPPSFDFISHKIEGHHINKNGYFLIQTGSINEFCTYTNAEIVRRLGNSSYIVYLKKGHVITDAKQNFTLFGINNHWKLSDRVKPFVHKKSQQVKITVKVTDTASFYNNLRTTDISYKLVSKYRNIVTLKLPSSHIKTLMNLSECVYIDATDAPVPETEVSGLDMAVNQVNTIHNTFPELNGSGHTISVKEQLFDTLDIDLKNRYTLFGTEAAQTASHATQIASLIGGAGNTSKLSRGVVNAVQLTSSDFFTLLPDPDAVYKDHRVFVQNHSYGTTVLENFYGAHANAYDTNTSEVPELIHVFSIGNKGDETPVEGPYTGIPGYANMTGNFKNAKNVLTVGATNKQGIIDERSSKGPAFDGRIKPELVAYAPLGSSDAAALVSGISTMLQQAYKKATGQYPLSSLIRAALIAGADDVGPTGIDFQSGYGSVNAQKSLQIIHNQQYITNEVLLPASQNSYELTIPDNTRWARIALVWNDLPANSGDTRALVNDLDLALEDPAAQSWKPWVLNHFPHLDSISKPAVRKEDHLNTIEYISLKNPVSGTYTIRVKNNSLSAPQSFSIAYSLDRADTFKWTYPTAGDKLSNEEMEYLRWETYFDSDVTRIEYTLNNSEWILISDQISADKPFLSWDTTGLTGIAKLRAEISGIFYESDSFTISGVLQPQIAYNCDESVAIQWDAVEFADHYVVKTLGETYMEPLGNTPETTFEISKNQLAAPYISVHPVFNTIDGIRGRAINYTLQGVNCYYRNFFAFMDEEETVRATLNLSTSNQVARVVFERVHLGIPQSLQEFSPPFSSLTLQVSDNIIPPGTNTYRARIILEDGSEILTDEVDIFFPSDVTFIMYPVPASPESGINIISRGNNLTFRLVDLSGRVVKEEILEVIDQRIEIPHLARGIYIGSILKGKKVIQSKKILFAY